MRQLFIALAAVAACAANAQTAQKKPAPPPAAAAQAPAPAPAPVPAPEPSVPVWEKEPEAFLGVKLNEPFAVPACPMETIGQYYKTQILNYNAMKSLQGVCYNPNETSTGSGGSSTYRLANLPDVGVGYKVFVHLKNGAVSKITIELTQSNFAGLLSAFKDRYGEPTLVTTKTVKTQAGAEFSASDVMWRGKKLSISMYERLNRVDESYVLISDNAAGEAELDAQRQKRSSEAQKF